MTDMVIKEGVKFEINDSVLGNIIVSIKEVVGEMVRYENSILNYTGMCHISIFKNMIVL